jgi:hypothetical protein
MATLARRGNDPDIEILLVSKNSLHQLLSDRIKLFDPTQDQIIGPEELRARERCGPEQAVDIRPDAYQDQRHRTQKEGRVAREVRDGRRGHRTCRSVGAGYPIVWATLYFGGIDEQLTAF